MSIASFDGVGHPAGQVTCHVSNQRNLCGQILRKKSAKHMQTVQGDGEPSGTRTTLAGDLVRIASSNLHGFVIA